MCFSKAMNVEVHSFIGMLLSKCCQIIVWRFITMHFGLIYYLWFNSSLIILIWWNQSRFQTKENCTAQMLRHHLHQESFAVWPDFWKRLSFSPHSLSLAISLPWVVISPWSRVIHDATWNRRSWCSRDGSESRGTPPVRQHFSSFPRQLIPLAPLCPS